MKNKQSIIVRDITYAVIKNETHDIQLPERPEIQTFCCDLSAVVDAVNWLAKSTNNLTSVTYVLTKLEFSNRRSNFILNQNACTENHCGTIMTQVTIKTFCV